MRLLRPSLWPPVARRILLGWIAAWPTLTLVLLVLAPISTGWPLPLRSLASATGMVLAMNFLSLPLARRALPWLA